MTKCSVGIMPRTKGSNYQLCIHRLFLCSSSYFSFALGHCSFAEGSLASKGVQHILQAEHSCRWVDCVRHLCCATFPPPYFPALHPSDINKFFELAFRQAQMLKDAYDSANEDKKMKIKLPFVTVCVDCLCQLTLISSSSPSHLFLLLVFR